MLEKSMAGEEVARMLIDVLFVGYGVSFSTLLAAMRDRTSVNNVAMKTIKVIFPQIVDVSCFSHTINLAGEHFKITILSEFITSLVSLFPTVRRLGSAGRKKLEFPHFHTALQGGGANGKSCSS